MSRKVRWHKAGWERKAKKTAQLLNEQMLNPQGFGITSA